MEKKTKEQLTQLFNNKFDCYADVDKDTACLDDDMTPAMTKEMFIEVVTEIQKDMKQFFATDAQVLERKKRRFVSHTTCIKCAHCGHDFKIDNRYPTPMTAEQVSKNLCVIHMPCANCNETYEFTICRLT